MDKLKWEDKKPQFDSAAGGSLLLSSRVKLQETALKKTGQRLSL